MSEQINVAPRPVAVLHWPNDGQQRPLPVEKYRGVFLGWGADFEEFEAGPGNYTVAIVEGRDGYVELVNPRLIRFLDRQGGDVLADAMLAERDQ